MPAQAEGPLHRVLLVEDDEDFIEALQLVVDERVELTLARTRAEASSQGVDFDAALVDLGLPDGDGVDVVREIAERAPHVPVVVLTVHRANTRILAAFQAGACGYLLKEQLGERLLPALREALEGGCPMSPSVARHVLTLVRSLPEPVRVRSAPSLTERELSVLRVFSQGGTYSEAAETLGVSLNTLRTHVRSIYSKLVVETRTEAVLHALQLGLLGRDTHQRTPEAKRR